MTAACDLLLPLGARFIDESCPFEPHNAFLFFVENLKLLLNQCIFYITCSVETKVCFSCWNVLYTSAVLSVAVLAQVCVTELCCLNVLCVTSLMQCSCHFVLLGAKHLINVCK